MRLLILIPPMNSDINIAFYTTPYIYIIILRSFDSIHADFEGILKTKTSLSAYTSIQLPGVMCMRSLREWEYQYSLELMSNE